MAKGADFGSVSAGVCGGVVAFVEVLWRDDPRLLGSLCDEAGEAALTGWGTIGAGRDVETLLSEELSGGSSALSSVDRSLVGVISIAGKDGHSTLESARGLGSSIRTASCGTG